MTHDKEICNNAVFRGKNYCNGTLKFEQIEMACPCECHADLKDKWSSNQLISSHEERKT